MAIDIVPLMDLGTDSSLGYMAKGHHSPEDMQAAIRWQWNDEFEVDASKTEHTTMRRVPYKIDIEGWGDMHMWGSMIIPSKPGRGAFACTVVNQ